jgi:hypothetical protein
MKIALLLVAAAVSMVPQVVLGGENAFVSVRDVPANVRSAADFTLPEVSWLVARQDDKGWYRLAGLNAQKKLVQFLCDAQANNGYFRIEVLKDELPEAVQSVLQKNYPQANITQYQASGLADGKVTVYRFEASNLPDGFRYIYVSANGKKSGLAND